MPESQQIIIPCTPIRIATTKDKAFVDDLAIRFSNAVGFIPGVALDWYISAGCVRLGLENGEPAGYILSRNYFRWNIAMRPITQAAVCMDAQRRHIGLGLLADLENDAREAGQIAVQACCREGLESNAFWQAAGFEKICLLDPQAARRRLINVWRKQITPHRPAWFAVPPPVAGYRAKKTKVVKP